MPLPASVAAVIFDNDGTLVDSREGIIRAWMTWAFEHEIEIVRLLGHDGLSSEDIVRKMIPAATADAALARALELEVREAVRTRIHPGVAEAMAAIPADRLAVATSGTRAVATARLAAAGIELPSVVVTVDDVARAKPDPDIFLLAAERLGFPPEDCLVVEDAPHGITAGKAAGCSVLAVTTTVAREHLHRADGVVDRLDEVCFTVTASGRVGVEMRTAPGTPATPRTQPGPGAART
ncbi:MAG TPA: HAD-IA family hydrolase [Actinomycetaceae bacterium]|nr:HAD-IA family hydrolase [Actinomycetaceae bacterium]